VSSACQVTEAFECSIGDTQYTPDRHNNSTDRQIIPSQIKFANHTGHFNAITFIYPLTVCMSITDCIYSHSGRDSSLGIATGYGLDGPGIESRWDIYVCICFKNVFNRLKALAEVFDV
jgi:hypothetical protein